MSVMRSSGGVEILAKASAIVDLLVLGQASVAEIAKAIGEPVSSVYRLVASLTEFGWVEAGTLRGRYRLAPGIVALGGLVEARLDLQRITRSVLWPMRSQTTGAWSLFVRRGLRAVCIEMVSDFVVERFSPQVGYSVPLDQGSASLVLVTFMPESEREAALEMLLASSSGAGAELRARHRFRTEVLDVREHGYALDIEEITPGVATVAAPVFNRRGEIEAAVCLSGLSPEDARTRAAQHDIALVRLAAARISAQFGYNEQPVDSDRDDGRNT